MAFRPYDQSSQRTPGPADYYTVERREPKITIKGRLPSINKDTIPGPGAYAPEISGPSAYKGAPKYSFGSRTGRPPSQCKLVRSAIVIWAYYYIMLGVCCLRPTGDARFDIGRARFQLLRPDSHGF